MRTLTCFICRMGSSLLLLAMTGMVYGQEGEDKSNKPEIRWDVQKEYDENGNIIRYDSSYSWYYSTPGFSENLPDSFREFFDFSFPDFFENDSFPVSPFGQFPFDESFPPSGRSPHSDTESDSLFTEFLHMRPFDQFFKDPFFEQFFNDEFFEEDSAFFNLHAYPFFSPFITDPGDMFKKHNELMEKFLELQNIPPDSLDFDRQHWNAPPARKKSLKELEI